jgi:hypothetical protein
MAETLMGQGLWGSELDPQNTTQHPTQTPEHPLGTSLLK